MGTAEPARRSTGCRRMSTSRFYSLSRDGDSGTSGATWTAPRAQFLFAVARWGQRNRHGIRHGRRSYVSIRCREMGTAEHHGEAAHRDGQIVSIRCREMGTAELRTGSRQRGRLPCFYSLSRDGDSGTSMQHSPRLTLSGFYSLSRDGDSGTLPPLTSF